jgi:hypothetical protein
MAPNGHHLAAALEYVMTLFEAAALPATCWLIFFFLYCGRERRPFRKNGIPARDAVVVATLLTGSGSLVGWLASYLL